jgi:hypothetical protein
MDQKHSSRSQWPSPPSWPSSHSNEVEHRITILEVSDTNQTKFNDKVKSRLWRVEKAIQLMAGVLWMLINGKAHDWAPSVAELLIRLIKMP